MNGDTIVRSAKKDNFTLIDNRVFADSRLSLKATGLLCYLLSKPPNWQVRIKDIVNHFDDGEYAIRSAIAELVRCKYMRGEQMREGGKFVGYQYTVSEVPEGGFPENPPYRGFPHTGNPHVGNRVYSNTELTKTELTNINGENFSKSEPAQVLTCEPSQVLFSRSGDNPPAIVKIPTSAAVMAEGFGLFCEVSHPADLPPDHPDLPDGPGIVREPGDASADLLLSDEFIAELERRNPPKLLPRRTVEEIKAGIKRAVETNIARTGQQMAEYTGKGLTEDAARKIIDYVANLPEELRPLGEAFCKCFLRSPLKIEEKGWLAEFRTLADLGITAADITAAYKRMTADGMTIRAPLSLKSKAEGFVRQRREQKPYLQPVRVSDEPREEIDLSGYWECVLEANRTGRDRADALAYLHSKGLKTEVEK